MGRRVDCRAGHGPRALLLLALLAPLAGCATVEPWQRGVLAKPHMALDPLPLQSALRAHVQGSRQAGAAPAGAVAAEGGGCGCY